MASGTSQAQHKQMPKDALVIASILKELGVNEYEPRVINQLLEFVYRYCTSVLEDAKVFSNHAKKKMIDMEDVRLAVTMQQDRCFTNPPARDVLLEVARTRNNGPLPLVKPHCGVRLPPDRYCLNNCNYRLRTTAPKKFGTSNMSTTSYGGPAGRPAKMPQLQLTVKRPLTSGLTTVPRTQSISQVPKPVIKFTPAGLQTHKLNIQNIQISGHGGSEMVAVKVEGEDASLKRKREPDEFEVMETTQ